MSNQSVENSTKSAKIPVCTWELLRHEKPKRNAGIGDLIGVAVDMYMALPEARRAKAVRDAGKDAA